MTKLLKPIEPGKYISPDKALEQIDKMPDAPEITTVVTPIDLEDRIIDAEPAANDNKKTQIGWVRYFNDENKVMISMPDLYWAGKHADGKLLDSLRWSCRDDFETSNGLVTSTRIIHNPEDKYGRIIHYCGSEVAHPVEYKTWIDYQQVLSCNEIENAKKRLGFLQALFGTNDKGEEILNTLMRFGMCGPRMVWIETINKKERREYSVREAVFYRRNNGLFIQCNGKPEGPKEGRSREVTIKDSQLMIQNDKTSDVD
jgi:hypothetical protein